MNTFIFPALDAVDLLALARLDDDGAPPAVGPPRSADGQTQPRDGTPISRATGGLPRAYRAGGGVAVHATAPPPRAATLGTQQDH